MLGLEVDGFVFKDNGEDLSVDEFLKLIESVGLEVCLKMKVFNDEDEANKTRGIGNE
jgi:hypothetical protein